MFRSIPIIFCFVLSCYSAFSHDSTNNEGSIFSEVAFSDLKIIALGDTTTDSITACDSLLWIDGITYYTDTNSVSYLLTNGTGGDSLVYLELIVNSSSFVVDPLSACDSLTWIDGNTYYADNFTATHTLTNAIGCDSTIQLDLSVKYASIGTDIIAGCDSLLWIDGITYYANNSSAMFTITNTLGCDSVVSLDLTMAASSWTGDTLLACDSLTWIDGITYTASTNTTTFVLTNAVGCDSTIQLDLTINYSDNNIDAISTCDSYTWIDGNTYFSNNNTATQSYTSATGCDSIITLNLSILNSISTIDTLVACNSLTWIDGITYTSNTTTALITYTNMFGCDSIIRLNLTINAVDDSVTVNEAALAANQSGAIYQWVYCDSNFAHITGATGQTYIATEPGKYAVIISANGCTDTSDCEDIVISAIAERLLFNNVNIYPNPSKGVVNISLRELASINLKIYSVSGQLVYSKVNVNSPQFQIELNKSSGVYIVEIESQGNLKRFRLILE
jgi:hypothetical protein